MKNPEDVESAARGGLNDNPAHGDPPHGAVPARYVTAELAGIGGHIKERAEDFLVDEQPMYQPSGEGEHVYLFVQKRGLSTLEMVDVIAGHFKVPRGSVGFAGMKDKKAITRQVVSVHVPGKKPESFPMLEHEKIEILWTDLHANKLRPGHLKGNRFSIRVRGVEATAVLRAKRVIDALETRGLANRYGEQRFGMLERNHVVGAKMIAGDDEGAVRALLGVCTRFPEVNAEARAAFEAGKFADAEAMMPHSARAERHVLRQLARGKSARLAIGTLDERIRKFYVSAAQSAVFNAVLDARLIDGTWDRLIEGDVAMKLPTLAPFDVTPEALAMEGEESLTTRLERFEVSASGPMWGVSMRRASGCVAEIEEQALAVVGLDPAKVEAFAKRSPGLIDGSRRPLRVKLVDPEVEGGLDEHGTYVRCAFSLSRGGFATVVMREVIKPTPGAGLITHGEDGDANETE